jgi:hypothetical protein
VLVRSLLLLLVSALSVIAAPAVDRAALMTAVAADDADAIRQERGGGGSARDIETFRETFPTSLTFWLTSLIFLTFRSTDIRSRVTFRTIQTSLALRIFRESMMAAV